MKHAKGNGKAEKERCVDPDLRIELPPGMGAIVKRKDGALLTLGGDMKRYSSRDGGLTWSKGQPLKDPKGKVLEAGSVSSLLRTADGALVAILTRSQRFAGSYDWSKDIHDDMAMTLIRSGDEGKTWARVGRINPPGNMAGPLDNTLIQLESGRLLLPVRYCAAAEHPDRAYKDVMTYGWIAGKRVAVSGHYHYPEIDIAFAYYSDDQGKTWQRSRGDIMGWFNQGYDGVTACDEPNVVETRDGRVLMVSRSTVGRLVVSASADGGVFWNLVQPLPLASSYSPCRLRRIPGTGDLLLVWNQVSPDEIRRGYRRGRLSAAISTDEGQTWKNFKTIEVSPGLDQHLRFVEPLEVKPVRGLRDVGELPRDFAFHHYANVSIVDDKVFVMYLSGHMELAEQITQEQKRVLRVFPLDWFYIEDH